MGDHVHDVLRRACPLCTFSFIHGRSLPALRLGTLVPRQKLSIVSIGLFCCSSFRDVLQAVDKNKKTGLHWALELGKYSIIEVLLQYGAGRSVVNQRITMCQDYYSVRSTF